MKSIKEILAQLNNFTGTEKYHRFSSLFPNILLTDGANHLANQANCFWLMDIIASVQHLSNIKTIELLKLG